MIPLGPSASVNPLDRLVAEGRFEEALAEVRRTDNSAASWPAQVDLLKRMGRFEEALVLRQAQVEASPASAVAEHNLASLLGDIGRNAEAEAAARRAFAKGGIAPETWLVFARSLAGQSKNTEAEQAFREVLVRRPLYLEALRELAQLVWMQTADAEAALLPIRQALAAAPGHSGLLDLAALVMEFTGAKPREVLNLLSHRGGARDLALDLRAATIALTFDSDLALAHAEAACAAFPEHPLALLKLSEVLLARGELARAGETLSRVQLADDHQNKLSLQATLQRLAGVQGGEALNDYGAFVRGARIDTPPGWSSLDVYLTDLAETLRRLHVLKSHPIGQSLRHGTQTPVGLRFSEDPVIKAFFLAINGPIRRYLDQLGAGDDPLRRRNTGDYRIAGCWSVQLAPLGFHVPHVHPEGWLSSACYIDVPPAVDAGRHEGWIGFGQPPFPCTVPTPPEHFEKPEPGKLVLFPSYMWHGTVPFTGDRRRLTIAFDLVPA